MITKFIGRVLSGRIFKPRQPRIVPYAVHGVGRERISACALKAAVAAATKASSRVPRMRDRFMGVLQAGWPDGEAAVQHRQRSGAAIDAHQRGFRTRRESGTGRRTIVDVHPTTVEEFPCKPFVPWPWR